MSLTTFGQDITGKWYGLLKVPGAQLPIEINVTKTENGYKSTMDKTWSKKHLTYQFLQQVLKMLILSNFQYQQVELNMKELLKTIK